MASAALERAVLGTFDLYPVGKQNVYRNTGEVRDEAIGYIDGGCMRMAVYVCDACEMWTVRRFTIGDVALCDACAERVANEWSKVHSGRYLTWPNEKPADEAPRRPKIFTNRRATLHQRDHYRCRYCGGFEGGLVLDHVMPFIHGGATDDDNLVTACWPCNNAKRDRTPEEAGMVLLPVPGLESSHVR